MSIAAQFYEYAGRVSLFVSGVFPAHVYYKLRRGKDNRTIDDYAKAGSEYFGKTMIIEDEFRTARGTLADGDSFTVVRRALNEASRKELHFREPFELMMKRMMRG